MFVLRFIAFDTRLHYIISEYWRTGRRRGGNNQNFVPPPVEADTNEDDWGVFSKVERVYIFLIKYAESMQKVCSAKALLLVPIWYSSNQAYLKPIPNR